MRTENEDFIDPARPSLIVTYGNSRRKVRPLDRDIFTIGRGSGCDFGLVSTDVAPVHCVIARLPTGWRLRDCSGRKATRVNGRTIEDVLLANCDVIQIGAFSFEVRLPGGGRPGSKIDVGRVLRSRRNLAQHALRFRAQVRELADEQADLEAREKEVIRQEDQLRALRREMETRLGRCEAEKRQLQHLRADLDREQAELQETRAELEAQGQDTERHLAQERVLLAQERAELDQLRREQRQQCSVSTDPDLLLPAHPPSQDDRAHALDLRAAELRAYAAHLHRIASKVLGGPETVYQPPAQTLSECSQPPEALLDSPEGLRDTRIEDGERPRRRLSALRTKGSHDGTTRRPGQTRFGHLSNQTAAESAS